MKVYDCYPTYLGCKRSLAVDIISKIKEMYPNTKTIVDAFGGSGAISITAIQMGLNALYNEKTERVARAVRYLVNGDFTDLEKFMLREDYYKNMKGQIESDADCFKTVFMYGFVGGGSPYVIPHDEFEQVKISIIKFLLEENCDASILYPYVDKGFHTILDRLFNVDGFIIDKYIYVMPTLKKILIISKYNIDEFFNLSLNELQKISFKQIQNKLTKDQSALANKIFRVFPIERIACLRNHKYIDFQKMEISNKDAFDLDLSKYNPETTVLYFDPPYNNTGKSGNYTDFDSNTLPLLFDKFKQFPIFLSEYSPNIRGLQEVYTKRVPHFNGEEYAKEVLYFKPPLR
ncbi:putative methyltransferase [Campylobacter phage vB_Cj_QDYZ]|uniref:site-specific DNA-methyltransferase (adenine-specific) n=1 Tax=Campylobacter phage vB_Cj_QDYZ TaxID=3032374 RepID=A0AAF0JYQ8_9CAUD|nr:putative methyltransferase [Campylobacter phage CP39]WGA02386.1 putative methyltransferase [Campylobacter phage vB_Cj_QDYZ]